MNREEKIRLLLLHQGVEYRRRLVLARLDEIARQTNTWGSKEHRAARDETEHKYDSSLHAYDHSSEDEIDEAIRSAESTGCEAEGRSGPA
jgi:hypothetical protein